MAGGGGPVRVNSGYCWLVKAYSQLVVGDGEWIRFSGSSWRVVEDQFYLVVASFKWC